MASRTLKLLKWLLVIVLTILATVLVLRFLESWQGPPLQRWHTFVPTEPSVAEMDRSDWTGYLAAENAVFEQVRAEVTQKADPAQRGVPNRYYEGSPIHPGGFKHDWNRSFVLQPDAKPVGVAVLVHGLTDSPYSVRHLARRYRDHGYVAIGVRMPGHGTVPGALTRAHWEDWMAATRLAVREARRLAGPAAPLHVVGYSNGGALVMKYALDAVEDRNLARPDRVVLLSPMIGVTSSARFAGVWGWPAILPGFAKAAWLGIDPEFNPFKYNSFPVNGGRQSSLLTRELQRQIERLARDGQIGRLAPVITFQSVVDFTVSTPAIVTELYAHLPANGSELVLFDINRNAKFGPVLRPSADALLGRLERIMPPPPRAWRSTIVANIDGTSSAVQERTVAAGAAGEQVRPLGLSFPSDIYSLSHLALPFPLTDGLYGLTPDPADDFGVQLGALSTRGERGVLVISLDGLFRLTSNPFYDYVAARIDEGIAAPQR
ncbi:alpha/beta hydrolase [Rivibacter subsaxonicus]|uniref:Serine aminopeptidase S33 family n=1 Tax=Rivibacter subsaxonicus TaxID=457575 RepID=A0A4Q7VB89_9BURK|nr:alpha/beta hydrolase [Rivibacter subsaxonicus]RZT91968.1 serine aminopeptidase S33 family [Rivibacter subsaxonicus]